MWPRQQGAPEGLGGCVGGDGVGVGVTGRGEGSSKSSPLELKVCLDRLVFACISDLWCKSFEPTKGNMMPLSWWRKEGSSSSSLPRGANLLGSLNFFACISDSWCKTFEPTKGSMMPLFCEDGARCSAIFVVSWGVSQMLRGVASKARSSRRVGWVCGWR